MESKPVTRYALETDERVFVAQLGGSGWSELLLLAKAAKRAGLHLEIDPSPSNSLFVEVHVAQRSPTKQRKDG